VTFTFKALLIGMHEFRKGVLRSHSVSIEGNVLNVGMLIQKAYRHSAVPYLICRQSSQNEHFVNYLDGLIVCKCLTRVNSKIASA